MSRENPDYSNGENFNVDAGTVGGSDWTYYSAGPFFTGYRDWTVPAEALGVAFDTIGDYSYIPPHGASEDVKNKVLQYFTPHFEDDTGLVLTSISLKQGFPITDIVGPKIAFLRTGEHFVLYGNKDGSITEMQWEDLSSPQGNYVGGASIGGGLFPYYGITDYSCYIPNRTSVDFYLDGDEDSEYPSKMYWSTIPYFYSDNFYGMTDYLSSEDPDPSGFGGVFGDNPPEPYVPEIDQSDDVVPGEIHLGFDTENGIIRLVEIENSALQTLAGNISLGLFAGNLDKALISIKKVATPQAITHGNETAISGGSFGSNVPCVYIPNQFEVFDMGYFNFPEYFESWLDYENTSISIYLPFSGLHNLDAKTVIGGSIHLKAHVDYISGSVIYYITVRNDVEYGSGTLEQLLYEFTGNCTMEMPVTAIDFAQKITQGITGIMQIAGASINTNFNGILNGAGQLAKQAMSNDYIQVGSLASNMGWTGIMYPFLIISRSKVNYPSNYGNTLGYPSEKRAVLSSLRGFTRVKEIHLDGVVCTDREREELERGLKEGVIL